MTTEKLRPSATRAVWVNVIVALGLFGLFIGLDWLLMDRSSTEHELLVETRRSLTGPSGMSSGPISLPSSWRWRASLQNLDRRAVQSRLSGFCPGRADLRRASLITRRTVTACGSDRL